MVELYGKIVKEAMAAQKADLETIKIKEEPNSTSKIPKPILM